MIVCLFDKKEHQKENEEKRLMWKSGEKWKSDEEEEEEVHVKLGQKCCTDLRIVYAVAAKEIVARDREEVNREKMLLYVNLNYVIIEQWNKYLLN